MKIRQGFVSNSSSTSFIITNKTDQRKWLVDFVKENPQLLQQFLQEYDWYKDNERFTQAQMIGDAERRDKGPCFLEPKESKEVSFGDEDGDVLGHVFDYMLRDGGSSESFTWEFHEYNR